MIVQHTIRNIEDVKDFINIYNKYKPLYTAFDTETTGLNIVKDTPFLIVFGFISRDEKEIHTWLLDQRLVTNEIWDSTLYAMKNLFNRSKYVIGHNIKYDLHMLANIGYEEMFTNITDTQIVIRLSHESLTRQEGGAPDDLTGYATKYIDPNAKLYQRQVKMELARLKREQTKQLLDYLKENHPVPEQFGNRKWSMAIINELTNDVVVGLDNIPIDIADAIIRHTKPVTWDQVNTEVLHKYAHMDVVYPLQIFVRQYPVLLNLEHEKVFERENDLIIPLYRSERYGLPFNKEYAEQVLVDLKKYIIKKRARLIELAGEEVTVGQHEKLKEIFQTRFNFYMGSTGKDALEDMRTPNKEQLEFRDLIIELRSLEKWYSTYLVGYIENEYEGRIRTSFKQAGTVTGRLSSGFQQFPRRGIRDSATDELLFHPRRLVKVDPNSEYNRLAYIDYSQIELRVQAIYTILISGGDLNLCRSFMPFKCINKDGEKYVNGSPFVDGEWFLEENPSEVWHPVDVHSKTAEMAFGEEALIEDRSYYRSIGKTTNFASNYGSGVGGIMLALKSTVELATKMHQAYSRAYPQIFDYRRYVQQLVALDKGVRNLYHRKYFGTSSHKIGNYLVQGSSADIIKIKMIELDNYIKEKGYKSRVLMNIHDEIQFELHKDEPDEILYEFKAIMENIGETPVPIVADIEISYTSWDEVEEIK